MKSLRYAHRGRKLGIQVYVFKEDCETPTPPFSLLPADEVSSIAPAHGPHHLQPHQGPKPSDYRLKSLNLQLKEILFLVILSQVFCVSNGAN